jgi:hypothetical protein
MKNGPGGSLPQIAAAAIETIMLINKTMNVPTRALQALSSKHEIAEESEITVLIRTINKMMMGSQADRDYFQTKRKCHKEKNDHGNGS